MQLISLPVSPFAARVRIAIRAKRLDIQITPPPAGWPNDARFRDINPMGRIPVLILGDGEAIWESAVILETLEELFPAAPPLLPPGVLARARARLLVRCADHELMPPMIALAAQPDEPETRRLVGRLVDGLAILDGLIDGGPYAVGDRLSFADCALAPALFAARVTGERLGIDLLDSTPNVADYAAAVAEDASVVHVLAEMEDGLSRLVRVG
ncbi:glutathione S-transferase family protein [Caulobacter mirabilis]|uniref:glutathione S-transferase family protein n=1 Tax=Caulobacter mirabilis TaxID=69666 RepID=UPI001558DC8C|nr:glutathione S-transferase family protein [Caulobacter mirabilis]